MNNEINGQITQKLKGQEFSFLPMTHILISWITCEVSLSYFVRFKSDGNFRLLISLFAQTGCTGGHYRTHSESRSRVQYSSVDTCFYLQGSGSQHLQYVRKGNKSQECADS